MRKYTILCLISLILLGLSGCGNAAVNPPALLEPVGIKYDTAIVQRGEIYNISVYSGEVLPYVETVSFVTDGKLGELKVFVGDIVKEGQILATLDSVSLESQITSLEEKIDELMVLGSLSDRSKAADMEIAKERLSTLIASGARESSWKAKEVEIEMLQTEIRQDQELRNLELEQLNKQLYELKEQLNDTVITAPLSGKIVYVNAVNIGTSVKAYTPMICILDENRISISAEQISLNELNQADKVVARILDDNYEVTHVPYDNDEYIELVLSGEEVRTRFELKPEDAKRVESGQYVSISVIGSYKENALTIPVNALFKDEIGRYVYKIIDGQQVRCNVEIGMITESEAQVLEGLQEGDVIYVKE